MLYSISIILEKIANLAGGFDNEKENYTFNFMYGVGNYFYCMWWREWN